MAKVKTVIQHEPSLKCWCKPDMIWSDSCGNQILFHYDKRVKGTNNQKEKAATPKDTCAD